VHHIGLYQKKNKIVIPTRLEPEENKITFETIDEYSQRFLIVKGLETPGFFCIKVY